MNSAIRLLNVLAVLVLGISSAGCGGSDPMKPEGSDDATGDESAVDDVLADIPNVAVSWDPTDERVIKFIAYLKREGVTLEYAGDDGNEGDWKLTRPAPPAGRDVIFRIGSFPESLSYDEMRNARLDPVRLFHINTRAHLALSHTTMLSVLSQIQSQNAGGNASPGDLPQLGGRPINEAVGRLFLFYRPACE